VQQQTTPRPAAAGSNTYVIPRADVPRTAQEVAALEARIESLREQLQDAAARRNTVADNLKSADEQARSGYVERLQLLDTRIIAIENEISNSVARLAEAPPSARYEAAAAQQPPRPDEIGRVLDSAIPIVAIISVFGIAPIAIAVARFIWKRSTAAPQKAVGPDPATQDRLEHLQQSMDAIAIEVERISEGQRFVTKVMSERQLGGGAAEPVGAAKRSAVGHDRG
jgi:cell division septum initiation protein DivIVA